jgi:glucose-6-phosphate dehydrogenase assembly protein OpcA
MKVKVEAIEKELGKLWEAEAASARGARVELFTLVALVSEPRLLDRANDVLAKVARAHACRTIAAVWKPGATPELSADVSLHKNPARKNEACADAVVLEAIGEAREWIPGNIERILLGDVPACVWWVGDLPDADDLFDRMVRRADVVLVNSAEMDLRDLEKLAEIAQGAKSGYAFMDLTWVRLRGLQDLIARFFDDQELRPYLDGLKSVTLSFNPREGEADAASTRAGLLLGWMASALGFVPETAQWTKRDGGADLVVQREGSKDPVALRFQHDPRPGVHAGSITRGEIVCEANGKRARFSIERGSDPLAVDWKVDAPGVVVPSQTLRIGSHEESQLLIRSLERPTRDALLERSLVAAARILKPIAPRLSERPPRST